MPTTPNISRLSDDQLLASAIDLARRERSLNLQIIEHLREIGRRGLHLRHGYGSLFDYAVKELEFSEGSAYQRLQALKLSDEFPEVKQDMVEGDLSLTSVGYLQSAFDRHQRRWRQRAREQRRGGTGSALPGGDVPRDGGAGAAADALTGGGPPAVGGGERVAGGPGGDGALADGPTGQAAGVLSADTSGGWPAGGLAGGTVSAPLSAAAKRELITRARGKSTRQVRELIAEFDPELVRPRDRLRALGRDRWELRAVIDGECRRSLEQLLHWLSHVNPTMDYGELLQRVVADAVAKYDPARGTARRATRGERPATAAPKVKAGEGSPVGERRSRGAAPAKVGDGSRGGERRARHAADAAAEVSAGSCANRHQPGEAEPVSAVDAGSVALRITGVPLLRKGAPTRRNRPGTMQTADMVSLLIGSMAGGGEAWLGTTAPLLRKRAQAKWTRQTAMRTADTVPLLIGSVAGGDTVRLTAVVSLLRKRLLSRWSRRQGAVRQTDVAPLLIRRTAVGRAARSAAAARLVRKSTEAWLHRRGAAQVGGARGQRSRGRSRRRCGGTSGCGMGDVVRTGIRTPGAAAARSTCCRSTTFNRSPSAAPTRSATYACYVKRGIM